MINLKRLIKLTLLLSIFVLGLVVVFDAIKNGCNL